MNIINKIKKTVKEDKDINTKNTPYLVIVESPAKCKKIEKFLGFQYKCIASKGHIRGIESVRPAKDKHFPYEPIFEILPEKKSHVDQMHKIISQFLPDNILLGTDDDREGEAIAWHICMTFQLPLETTKRILFHEITEPALRSAVQSPIYIRMNIVHAQHARQVLDRLVGFQISSLLTKRVICSSKDTHLSAGRCQTPALRLIYDQEMKNTISDFPQKYMIYGSFFTAPTVASSFTLPIVCLLHSKKEKQTREECISFLNASKTHSHIFQLSKTQQKKTSAPKPFHTSSLLQAASHELHLSPKQTMYYCQLLYQEGLITYMRTESTKYSDTFLNQVVQYFTTKDELNYMGDLSLLKNTNILNAHEAIRVTNISKRSIDLEEDANKETRDKSRLYDLIWRRSMESCMSEYVYQSTTITISSPFEDDNYLHDIEIPVFLGWKKWEISLKEFESLQQKMNGLYLYLKTAQNPAKCMKIECQTHVNTGQKHYTEAGLIQALEDRGIGRPSTYSIIMDTIQERGYVMKKDLEGEKIQCTDYSLDFTMASEIKEIHMERTFGKEKNKLVLQSLGKQVINELIPTFDELFSYDFTKKMECELDKISQTADIPWVSLVKECDATIKKCSKMWKTEMKETYLLGDDSGYELFFSKKGPFLRKKITDSSISSDKEEYVYKTIRSITFDFEKLRNKQYTLVDLLEIPSEYLGDLEGKPVFLKKGQYGLYVVWGEGEDATKLSLSKKDNKINCDNPWEITLADIQPLLQKKTLSIENNESDIRNHKKLPENVLRIITESISIRKGKFGAYIYYKPVSNLNVKPQFYNIRGYSGNYLKDDLIQVKKWMEEAYGIV